MRTRSPAELRAIFAKLARRFPGDPAATMAARDQKAKRLRSLRYAVSWTRKELRAVGRKMRPMPATRELDAHVLSMANLKTSKLAEKRKALITSHKRRVSARVRYDTMRGLGMTKTRYGWE